MAEFAAERIENDAQFFERDDAEERQIIAGFAKNDRGVLAASLELDLAFADLPLDDGAVGENEFHRWLRLEAPFFRSQPRARGWSLSRYWLVNAESQIHRERLFKSRPLATLEDVRTRRGRRHRQAILRMGKLFDTIRRLVAEDYYVIGQHAAERLEERGIMEWQAVEALADGTLIGERPRDTPNPCVEVRQSLPDGTEFKAVWSHLRQSGAAKLVTVHFFDRG